MNRRFFSLQSIQDDLSTAGNFSLNVVIRYGSLVGMGGHLLFVFVFLWLGILPMAIYNVASCGIFLFAYWINRKAYSHLALLIGMVEVVIHAFLAVAFLGWGSSFHYFILGLVPLIFSSYRWRNFIKICLVALLCLMTVALYLYSQLNPPWRVVAPAYIQMIGVINILTLFIVFAVIAHFNLSATTYAENALKGANKKLEYLAHIDPLTKLFNRRNMLNEIAVEIDCFTRTGKPFSVILCDIDHFKEINDRYGHEAGDLILVKVADVLKSCIRDQDRVARWGGEEFLILLPLTEQARAGGIAERLREKVASTGMVIDETERQITMTFGVATYSCHSEAAECIRRADQAMYQGKHQGRNCVVVQN